MKPIGNNSGVRASLTSQPDKQDVTAPVLPGSRSIASARLEDIIGVAPKSVRQGNSHSAGAVKPKFCEQLSSRVSQCESADRLPESVAAALQAFAGFDFVGWLVPSNGQIGQTSQITGLTSALDGMPVTVQQAIQEVVRLPAPENSTRLSVNAVGAIGVPISRSGTLLLGFVANCANSAIPMSNRCAIEFAAAKIGEWQLQRQVMQSERDVRHVAAIVELVSRVSESSDIETAGRRVVDDLCQYLNASEVFLGTCATARTACGLTAISDTDVDRLSKSTQQAEAVLQESIARGAVSTWPSQDAANRHALLSHEQFATERGCQHVVACPLRNEAGEPVGSVIVTFRDVHGTSAGVETSAAFLKAAERPLASALQSLQRTNLSLVSRCTRNIRKICGRNRLKTIAAIVVAFTVAMLIPVDYRVECKSELQPVSRRFVAAPFDAPLDECLVEPGDVVEAEQLLATLDGRELRWELSGVRADLGKATKEHNAFLSERKSGEAAIARHEIERLQNQAKLLTDRTRNLEIRSPVAGVVVAGDLKETEGVPLKTGQSMFEIAPLNRMVIEIAIPEEDIPHVQDSMTVRLVLDAMPSTPITAAIQRIHPRAELRDHDNVFIAEAEIDNAERHLRPGMKGSAKVSTGSRTFGWTLFHKPVAHVIGWLGW